MVAELVTFDGSLSIGHVGIESFHWDFGDGSEPALGVAVEHGYDAAGVYDVVLTITDANDETAIASMQIAINEE